MLIGSQLLSGSSVDSSSQERKRWMDRHHLPRRSLVFWRGSFFLSCGKFLEFLLKKQNVFYAALHAIKKQQTAIVPHGCIWRNCVICSFVTWSSKQLWTQFKQLRIEAWKSQDFNGIWTRDLATPVRRSNQLSYEATDVGIWSFVSSNEPVTNECEVIYDMFHILNCGFELNQVRDDHRSCVCNLNCNNARNYSQASYVCHQRAPAIIIILGISCTVNYLEAHWVAGIYFVWFEIWIRTQ